MDPFMRGRDQHATGVLTTGGWSNPQEIEDLIAESQAWVSNPTIAATTEQPLRFYHKGCIFLGETPGKRQLPVGWKDDRHMITVAGSRAGKGRSGVIPNLYVYGGSVICVDPKGENARLTAEWRARPVAEGGLGQEVYVLDPFRTANVPERLRATFNPLWMVNLKDLDALEQVGAIAESIVIPGDAKDAHWDDSARDLIESLILHVLTWPRYISERNLQTVRRLLINGDQDAVNQTSSSQTQATIIFPGSLRGGPDPNDPDTVGAFDVLLRSMLQNSAFAGAISGQAQNLLNMGPEERGSVLSTARRNTKFLDGSAIPSALQKSQYNFDMKQFKRSPRGATVYLCLPARYMATHSRWLRLVINSLMTEVERSPSKRDNPILAVLDEFPVLGPLKNSKPPLGIWPGLDSSFGSFSRISIKSSGTIPPPGKRFWAMPASANTSATQIARRWNTFPRVWGKWRSGQSRRPRPSSIKFKKVICRMRS